VTNRGAGRVSTFATDADRVEFGRLLGVAHERFEVSALAYCLMGNHFHLVLDAPDGGLSPFMQLVSSVYTRHVNERHGGDGPLFRGRFFSRPLLSHAYLVNAVRYVHRNPIDLGFAGRLDEYRWSSHRTYLGMRRPPAWLDPRPVLDLFPTVESFRNFVGDETDTIRRDVTDALAVVGAVAPADWLSAVEHVVDEVADVLPSTARGVARTVAVLGLDHLPPTSATALSERLRFASQHNESRARQRARQLADERPTYRRLLHRALELTSAVNVVSDVTLPMQRHV
jgi:REP element-mobilizing transposase RayT